MISAPKFIPSNLNCTPATPTLSDAFAATVILPETIEPEFGLVIDTVGGVISGTAIWQLAEPSTQV